MLEKYSSGSWKMIVNSLQEGLMLVDPQGQILFINKALEEMVGYRNEELVGKNCAVFQCDQSLSERSGGMEQFCALFEENKERSAKCVLKTKEGKTLHLAKKAAVIYDENGKITCGVVTMIDLSTLLEKEKIIADLRQQLVTHEGFQEIVGTSPGMRQVIDLASSAAQSDIPLLIHGESGTGKELLANAIHAASQRRKESFIKVNCAALNENLLESELFGHVKGAFTGADYTRVGRFEAASGGSLFLDEIGDVPISTQRKLLRVLQEKEIERVGDHRCVKVDVRIMAATHKDLQQLIANGIFREDLYYRIGVIPIYIPPLRERATDIPLLVDHFIQQIGKRTKKPIKSISQDALDLLVEYSWPGNIRELVNAIEYSFVLCPGQQIQVSDLPSHLRQEIPAVLSASGSMLENGNATRRQKLVRALEQTGGNQTKAARILGVSRVTVWKWIKKYDVMLNAKIHS